LSDDAIGYQFSLFVLPEYQAQIEELELNSIQRLSIIYAKQAEILDWLNHNQAHAILVRPDRYIFGKASSQQSIEQLIKATHLYDVITQ
jgi:3-(3-hydroxy-phenyl)propionate hydroxylase